jgi:hypothetical protein
LRERERVHTSAATRWTSSCCSTARSCSYLHPLSQARCYLHSLHPGADGDLPPLLQLIDGKVFHPLVDGELVHPLQQHINDKQSELICSLASPSSCNCSVLHFCSSSFCTICFSLLAAAALCFALLQHISNHLEACVGCSLICYCNWLIAKLLAVCACVSF